MSDGTEDYSSYYYLWHLIAIGALKPTTPTPPLPPPGDSAGQPCPEIDTTIWEEAPCVANRVAKVGLIDMGISRFHPNLEPEAEGTTSDQQSKVLWDEALDLASHRYGATYGPMTQRHREERLPHLAGILAPALEARIGPDGWESNTMNRLQNGQGVVRYVDTYDQSYATHGTACAGLVCGTSYDDDQFGQIGNPIVYYGVAPHSKIVPITTSISPNPEQLIAAFLYAHSKDVDVILFPRDAADPLGMPQHQHVDKNEKTRLDNSNRVKRGWALFRKVIEAVSMDIPVVCASGNDGRSELIYPASLAEDADNGIIAVGSVTYRGYRSGYSNYGPGLTVVAPSDDGEVYNRHQMRLDKKASYATDFWTDNVHEHPTPDEINFSAERLVTLDVPGPRGYAAGSRVGAPVSSRANAIDDPGSLYTEIGGTSGASAIVAGAVALMQCRSAERVAGPAIKQKLADMGGGAPNTDISDWYWEEQDTLQLDEINGSTESAKTLFGEGGLVNLRTLLNI